MNASQMFDMLRGGPYYVFGTGFAAGMFLTAVREKAPEALGNLRGFLVTEPEIREYDGKPVLSYEEYIARGEETPVFAAVHESAAGTLPFREEDRVIMIAPFLTELLYGEPSGCRTVTAEEIRKNQGPDTFWIAVRFAGVRGILEKREDLKEIYLRAMALHCGRKTAARRWERLRSITEAVAHGGWDPGTKIALTEHFGVIDGLHRIALMHGFGIPSVRAVIYRESPVYYKVLDARNRLPLRVLRAAGFTESEITLLRELKEVCG